MRDDILAIIDDAVPDTTGDNMTTLQKEEAQKQAKVEKHAHMERVTALLHQTAELDHGASVVWVKASHLKGGKDDEGDCTDYARSNVLAKVKLVFSRPSYGHRPLRDLLRGQRIMIVGGHLAHQSSKAYYCPSIAALIASQDETATQYAGTARLQRTTARTPENSKPGKSNASRPKKTKTHTDANIVELEAMMKELFQVWRPIRAIPTAHRS